MTPLWLRLARAGTACPHASEGSFSPLERATWERAVEWLRPNLGSIRADDEQGDAATGGHSAPSAVPDSAASPSLPPWPPTYKFTTSDPWYEPSDVELWRDAALARIARLKHESYMNGCRGDVLAEQVTDLQRIIAIVEPDFGAMPMSEVEFSARDAANALEKLGKVSEDLHKALERIAALTSERDLARGQVADLGEAMDGFLTHATATSAKIKRLEAERDDFRRKLDATLEKRVEAVNRIAELERELERELDEALKAKLKSPEAGRVSTYPYVSGSAPSTYTPHTSATSAQAGLGSGASPAPVSGRVADASHGSEGAASCEARLGTCAPAVTGCAGSDTPSDSSPAPSANAPDAFDDMEGRGPCGGTRCSLSHVRDGVWIHSSKSYGTCSVRRERVPTTAERTSRDAADRKQKG